MTELSKVECRKLKDVYTTLTYNHAIYFYSIGIKYIFFFKNWECW